MCAPVEWLIEARLAASAHWLKREQPLMHVQMTKSSTPISCRTDVTGIPKK